MTYEKNNQNFELYYSNQFKGRGGWNISLEVATREEKNTFNHYTTNSQFIDLLSELRIEDADWNTIQAAYHEEYFYYFNEQVDEWIESINEQ